MRLHLYINALCLSVVLSACAQSLPDSVTAASKTSSASTSATATGNVSVVDPGAGSSTSGGTTGTTGTTTSLPVILDSTGAMVMSGQSYFLRNASTGNCLDVTGGATGDGTVVQPYACNAGFTNQIWTVTLSTTGSMTFTSVNGGSCLDMGLFAITSPDDVVQIYGCSGTPNQSFVLTASASGYRLSPSDALSQAIDEKSGQILGEAINGLTDQAYKLVPSSSANPAN